VYPDTGAPPTCGNQTRCDGVRPLVTGNSRICPDSAAARLRVVENSAGISCSPNRPSWHAAWKRTSPRLRAGDCPVLAGYGPAPIVPRCWYRTIGVVTRIVHVPYVVEQDEDGV